jgi:hypothetical protein
MNFIFEDNTNEQQNYEIFGSFSQDYSSDFISELISPTACRDSDLWFAKKCEMTSLNTIAQTLSKSNDKCDTSSIACDISSVIGECEQEVAAEPKLTQEADKKVDSVDSDLQFIVDEVFKSDNTKESKKSHDNLKCKQTKSAFQLRKLNEAYEKFPTKFPKKERVKLGKEIDLSETQIYKWYYDQKNKFGLTRSADEVESHWESEFSTPFSMKYPKHF